MSDDGLTLKLGGAATHTLGAELSVEILDGPSPPNERTIPSKGPSLVVGRAAAADVRLADPAVSAFHVELTSTSGGIDVRDLGSSNGTSCEGVRIHHAVVTSGATIRVGTTSLRVSRSRDEAKAIEPVASFGKMRGSSVVMRTLFGVLATIAPTDLSVLVEGPTGSGKELVADGLHRASARAEKPFVVLDCTSIPKMLAESVLFGHERGAFTGATHARPGLFEAADGGTLFIDEIGDLPLELQPKLLRVLEKREVMRLGETKPRAIDVRVLAATWRDLRKMVNEGTFREDLYFRLAQARIAIPSLADRADDVRPLVMHFLQHLPADAPGARLIAKDALEELRRRTYPGNVRELRSTVERAALLARGETITVADLAFERILSGERASETPGLAASAAVPEKELPGFKEAKRTLVDEFEREYLAELLKKCGDNLSRASALSGVERHHLRDLLRKHGLRGT